MVWIESTTTSSGFYILNLGKDGIKLCLAEYQGVVRHFYRVCRRESSAVRALSSPDM